MRIAILHASAGHGHQKVAEAVYEGLLACGLPPKDILLLDSLDKTPAWFGKLYRDLYYNSVKYTPGLWGLAYELSDNPALYRNVVRASRHYFNRQISQELIHLVVKEKPDVILSTHFFPPEVLGGFKEEGLISSYLITVITDYEPHSFWVNPGTDHYWVMSEEGEKNLESRGVPSGKITAGGIPVSLKFRPQGKKLEFRKKEGLRENKFTILVTSGSFGLGPASEVLQSLREFGDKIQVMVVCGRNQRMHDLLTKEVFPFQLKLYGFVSNMDELMEASDLLVAKPGGATATESLAKGVPVVVLRPIPGQEARNAHLLKERNAAFFLGKPSDIRIILKGILDYPEMLEEKRRIIQKLARPEAALNLARFVASRMEKATSHV